MKPPAPPPRQPSDSLVQIQPGRRDFLKAAGIAGVAAGLAGCKNPENILPLLEPDARQIPGRPQHFATVCRECPAGCGMVVRVNDGRATKAEGNPDHPVNRGRLCIRGQSAVQGLYNPDRLRQPRLRDGQGNLRPTDWATAMARFEQELEGGPAVWLGQLETGTMAQLTAAWMEARGFAAPLYYEPFSYDTLRAAQGGAVPSYHIERARYLLSFGAEFLETWISNVQFAGDFAAMHSLGHTAAPARVVCVGPRLNLSAANADEYWAARPGTEALLAEALVGLVGARLGRGPSAGPSLEAVAQASEVAADVIARAADRLVELRPSLVLGPGYANDTAGALRCHQAVEELNRMLGNVGVTVDPAAPHALSACATQNAVGEMFAGGQVRMLLLHHANPLYHQPGWRAGFDRIPFKVSFASWMDETTQFADLVLPDHHYLESWGDYSPTGAVTGVMQPTRLPLYDTRPTAEVLLATFPGRAASGYGAYLKEAWRGRVEGEAGWNALLRKGVAEAAAPPAARPGAPATTAATAAAAAEPPPPLAAGEYYLTIFPSVQLFDGRQANRSWCQEIAEPLSKIAWDGWAELHPDTAQALGREAGDMIRVTTEHGSAAFPVFLTTWIRRDTVGVLLGQGHTNFGMFANGRGEAAQGLQRPALPGGAAAVGNGAAPWCAQAAGRARVRPIGVHRDLPNLQTERLQRDKKLALAVTLAEADTPAAIEPLETNTFYDYHPHPVHRWGMSIDLDSCIGCNACQAACYAENNVAVWGRSSALSHREMTWIRVEVWEGDGQHPSTALNPDIRFLPMPCQQCGNAPCEYVCPVFAAYHTVEGLNAQVYNRCVGTRYCSNNCIYKVRRFNWYTPQWPQPLDQQLNPEVTVRSKGVMEKCTFCVQRIEAAELDAKTNHTEIRDGDIQTACMQTCPTNALVFGDYKDPDSRATKMAKQHRAYGLFADENTYPGVSYLKRVKFELNEG